MSEIVSPGIPVVDLSALVADLHRMADEARERRAVMLVMARSEAQTSRYLEELAGVLAGDWDVQE